MYANENKIKFDTHLGLENAWLSRNQIRIRPKRCDGIKGMTFKVFTILQLMYVMLRVPLTFDFDSDVINQLFFFLFLAACDFNAAAKS